MPTTCDQSDRDIADAERAVADAVAHVRSLIVRGNPSQAAEDRLRDLERRLAKRKEQR